MKYLIVLSILMFTGCASTDFCSQSNQSEYCKCYRDELPKYECNNTLNRPDRANRYDRF